jgi:hypothetical protein
MVWWEIIIVVIISLILMFSFSVLIIAGIQILRAFRD